MAIRGRIQNSKIIQAYLYFPFKFDIEMNVQHNMKILVMSNKIYSCVMQIFLPSSYHE